MPVSAPQSSPDASLVQCVGHSQTNGYGLPDQSLRASSRLAGMLGSAQEWNQSISGATLGRTVGSGISWIWQRVGQRRYRRTAPFAAASDVVMIQYGLNDMQALSVTGVGPAPNNTQGLAIFKNALRACIVAFRASAYFKAQNSSVDPSITLTGTWTAVSSPPGSPPGSSGGTTAVATGDGYRKTTVNTSTFSIAIPGDYPGGAVSPIFMLFVTDPATTSATLTATGAGTGTFDLTGANTADTVNSRQGLSVWRLSNIAASNGVPQTLSVSIAGTLSTGGVNLAGWGIEADTPPLIAVCDIAKLNPAGLFWGGIGNTDITTWNAGIQAIVAEFTDGNTVYVDTDTLLGGIGTVGTTSLSGNHTAAVTTITVGSTTNFSSAGAAMINPGIGDEITSTYGTEIVKYTGKTGTTLTGCTRGAYGTTAKAWDGTTVFNGATSPSNPNIREINIAAEPNFFTDGVHWTEQSQGLVAGEIYRLLAPKIRNYRRESMRVGPGRADVRKTAGCSIGQIIKRNTEVPLYFNKTYIDTAMMHDSTCGPRVNGFYPTGNPARWNRFYCKSDGLYQAVATWNWEQGRSTNGTIFAVSGLRGGNITVVRADGGGGYVGLSQSSVQASDTSIVFGLLTTVTAEFEFRLGDYVEVRAFQGGGAAGFTATTTSGSPSMTAVSDMSGVRVGSKIFGPNVPAGAFVIGMTVNTITLSANATAAGTTQIYTPSDQAGAGGNTTTTGALTAASTTIPVTSGAVFTNGDYLRIDDEDVLVTAGQFTTSLTVTRGQNGTTATTHASGADIHTGIRVPSGGSAQDFLPSFSIARLQAI